MLIAQFAKATGLSRDTIRFYVKLGLLQPEVGRTGTNRYQSFDAIQLDRALLVREAQALGWSLREIAALGEEYERGDLTDARKIELMRERLTALDQQANRLLAMRDYFQRKIAWLEAGSHGEPPAFVGGTLAQGTSSLCAVPKGMEVDSRGAAKRSTRRRTNGKT